LPTKLLHYAHSIIALAFCLLLQPAFADKVLDGDRISGIKGFDNRLPVNGTHSPWQAIGKIDTAGLFLCTGVLIDPNHVLTAAHCIWNRNTDEAIRAEDLGFVAGYHREYYMAERGIKSIRHSPSYSFKHRTQPSLKQLSSDWAVLELTSPINNIKSIPLSGLSAQNLVSTKKQRSITQAGFSGDREYILTADQQCRITKRYKNIELVGHNCDATKGDSGSPLLIRTNKGFQVVALHVGTQTFSSKKSVGIAIPTAAFKK